MKIGQELNSCRMEQEIRNEAEMASSLVSLPPLLLCYSPVLNMAARAILAYVKSDHVTLLLKDCQIHFHDN